MPERHQRRSALPQLLGAWLGPGPAWLGPVWFVLKAMFVFLLVTWVRWSFVRIRVDQILAVKPSADGASEIEPVRSW